jgi:hypothetical protein
MILQNLFTKIAKHQLEAAATLDAAVIRDSQSPCFIKVAQSFCAA